MIKASCISCVAELGRFHSKDEYLKWRRQTESCENCGADLDTSLFTSYVKGELPVEEKEQPVGEEEEAESPTGFGDILKGKRRK